MANQTIAQLPYDLSSADSLNRFLRELVDNLDEILGYKGTNRYVKDADFKEQGQTLEETTEQSKSNNEALETLKTTAKNQADEIYDLTADVERLNTLLKAAELDTVYFDFNNSAWKELRGKGTFTAKYSEMTHAPFSVNAGSEETEFEIYVESTETVYDVWQTVVVRSAGIIEGIYTRIGVSDDIGWTEIRTF